MQTYDGGRGLFIVVPMKALGRMEWAVISDSVVYVFFQFFVAGLSLGLMCDASDGSNDYKPITGHQ